MSEPRVSVLVTTFNRAAYLLEAVNSALNQTFRELEVIIVDDGSTDNSADLVRGLRDSRVRYLYQTHRGVSAALNTAWRVARGEFIGRLDSDDAWLPNLLEELVPALEAEPTLGLIYARAQGMDEQGRPLSQILGAPEKFPNQWLKSLLYGDCVCGVACVFRRTCIEQVGGFDESLIGNEDWDLWIRMAPVCRFAFCDEILARYRLHPFSLTGGRAATYRRVVLGRVELIEKYYARADVPPEALEVKSLARRNVYMDVTIRFLAVGQVRAACNYFMHTLRAAPNLFSTALRVLAVALFDLYLSKTKWGVSLTNALVARQRQRRQRAPVGRR